MLQDGGNGQAGVGIGHNGDLHVKAIGATGFCKKCLRLFGIEGDLWRRVIVGQHALGYEAAEHLALTVIDLIQYLLTINGHLQCFTDTHIVQRFDGGVEHEVIGTRTAARHDLILVAVVQEPLQLTVSVVKVEDIDLSLLEHQSLSVRVRHDVHGNAVDGRRALKVVGVSNYSHAAAQLPLGHLERAGTKARRRVDAEVLNTLSGFTVEDGSSGRRQTGQKRRVGRFKRKPNRQIVQRLHTRDALGLAVIIIRGACYDTIVNVGVFCQRLWVHHAVDSVHHVIGSQGITVMEGDALVKMEGIGQAIRAHIPVVRQPRHDLCHAVHGFCLHQPVKAVERNRVGVRGKLNIQRLRVFGQKDVQPVVRCFARCA